MGLGLAVEHSARRLHHQRCNAAYFAKLSDTLIAGSFCLTTVYCLQDRKSPFTQEAQPVPQTSVKAFKVNAGAGIVPSRDWDPRTADDPDAPLSKQSGKASATPACGNLQTSEEAGRSQPPESQTGQVALCPTFLGSVVYNVVLSSVATGKAASAVCVLLKKWYCSCRSQQSVQVHRMHQPKKSC